MRAAFSADCEDDCELDMAIISSAALRLCGCGALYEITVAVVVSLAEGAGAYGGAALLSSPSGAALLGAGTKSVAVAVDGWGASQVVSSMRPVSLVEGAD